MDVSLFPRPIDPFSATPGRRIVNLRPRTGIDGRVELVAAMPPLRMRGLKGWRAVCRLHGRLLVAAGTALALADDSSASAEPAASGAALPGEAVCALESGEGSAAVMTAAGGAIVGLDNGMPVCAPQNYDYPPISLRAVQVSLASAVVASRTLSKSYGEGHRMAAADHGALVGDLEAAYAEAVSKAASAGCMVQPAFARYRLLDRLGQELFLSAPVLLGTTQCADSVDVRIADDRTTSAYDISVKAWRVEMSWPAATLPGVAAVELLLSPQFHPYMPGARGAVTVVRDTSGYKARVSLPGIYRALTAERAMAALARIDSLVQPVGRVPAPFGGVARSVVLACAPEADAASAARSLSAALSAKVRRVEYADALLRAPHTFTASCVATDGIAVVWGAPKALRYAGYPLPLFAVETSDDAWQATVVVRFDGRRGVKHSCSGSGDCPVKLGPVLSYPSPDARSMSILLSYAGVSHRFDCQLTPDAGGARAVYVNPGLVPIELPVAQGIALVDIENADEEFASLIAVAKADQPFYIDRTVSHGGGRVLALEAVPGSEQSWDRGRSRFYAGCECGVLSVTVSAASHTVRMLDSRGVVRADSMAAGTEMVYALVRDAAGMVPVALSPRGVVKAVAPAADYVALAYDAPRAELWAVKDNGSVDVFSSWGAYVRTECGYTAVVRASGEYYGVHADGLDRIALVGDASTVPVEYTDSFSPRGRRAFRLVSVCADISAASVAGSLAVWASDGAGWPRRMFLARRMAGALKSPLMARVYGAPARSLSLMFEGVVDSTAVLRSFRLSGEDGCCI